MASEDMFANSEEMTLEDKINDVSSKVNIDSDTEMEQGEENRKDSDKSEEIDGTDQTVGEPEHNTLISDLIKSKAKDDEDLDEEPNDDSEVVDDPDQEETEDSENILSDKTNASPSTTKTPTKDSAPKLFRFPHNKIKQIMRLDPEVVMVNNEATFLVNKAVEEFIQCLAVEAYHHTVTSKKKTIMKDHVSLAIETNDELAFLDGAMED